MNQRQAIFIDESPELLEELEESLLELETHPEMPDLVDRVFRAMHTIKGSGGMCDFPNVARFTHELETVFDRLRKGELAVSKSLIETGLLAHHYISDLIADEDRLTDSNKYKGESILSQLQHFAPFIELSTSLNPMDMEGSIKSPRVKQKEDNKIAYYRIQFSPQHDFLTFGFNPLNILKMLGELGDMITFADTDKIPPLNKIDETSCYLSWLIILSTSQPEEKIHDIFEFFTDNSDVNIKLISDSSEIDNDYNRLGKILVERAGLSQEQVDSFFQKQPNFGEVVANTNSTITTTTDNNSSSNSLVSEEEIDSTLMEQGVISQAKKDTVKSTSNNKNIRVSSEKLDVQMDYVSELVIALASLNDLVQEHQDHRLSAITEKLDRIATGISSNLLSVRMLPIGGTFGKFRRMVRDLANELGKEIDLITEGDDTELDKSVIEQLGDPLMHLVRNAVDHGLELPKVRAEKGKPTKGIITLSAKHCQGNIVIDIIDDGKGIDVDKVWEKAIDKGLANSDNRPPDKDIFQYIFTPGFSTASTISDISGRGVGMDVVLKSIESIRGSIDIKSQIDVGTTITLRLPLTLAAIKVILFRIGETTYALPSSEVSHILGLTVHDKHSGIRFENDQALLYRNNKIIPMIEPTVYLDNLGQRPSLKETYTSGLETNCIVFRHEGKEWGLCVDEIIAMRDIIVKPMESSMNPAYIFSGIAVLGSGDLALVMNLKAVVGNKLENQNLLILS